MLRKSASQVPFGSRRVVDLENTFGPLTTAVGLALILYLAGNPHTNILLADSQNPLRIATVIAGSLLMRASKWTPRTEEPELVTRCRDHLYRLQTTQSTTNGLSTTAQLLGLGSTHTSAISTLPPNFPELVHSFRTLLADIARAKHAVGQTVVIAIDEVDRLGTDTKALAFLSEIKAVLGIPHMHFLISIADDVGAAFVRRGLPHRDVTDSSLDDIVHVQPATLTESTEIFAERSAALTAPYAMLAHSLSGGILRDLHRYANQIKEMQAKSESYELAEISRHLILEELSETLAGFRTLLSKRHPRGISEPRRIPPQRRPHHRAHAQDVSRTVRLLRSHQPAPRNRAGRATRRGRRTAHRRGFRLRLLLPHAPRHLQHRRPRPTPTARSRTRSGRGP